MEIEALHYLCIKRNETRKIDKSDYVHPKKDFLLSTCWLAAATQVRQTVLSPCLNQAIARIKTFHQSLMRLFFLISLNWYALFT